MYAALHAEYVLQLLLRREGDADFLLLSMIYNRDRREAAGLRLVFTACGRPQAAATEGGILK